MKIMKTKNDEKAYRFKFTPQLFRTSQRVRILMFAVFYITLVSLSFYISSADAVKVNVGDICPENIIAPTRIVDSALTEALRKQASDMTSPVYDYISAAQAKVTSSLESIRRVITDTYPEYAARIDENEYNSICSINLTKDDYIYLINASGDTKNTFIGALTRIVSNIYTGEVKSTEIDSVKQKAKDMLSDFSIDAEAAKIAEKVLNDIIAPNMILNENATEIARKAARDSVYEIVYEAGQTIINKGEIITEHHMKLLKDNGLINVGLFENVASTIGVPGVILAFLFIFVLYLKIYYPQIYSDNKQLAELLLLFVISILLSKVLSSFSVYLVPAAMLALCTSLLFGPAIAVQMNVFMICFLSVTLVLDIDSFVYLLISGYVGIVYKNKITKRSDLFKSGFIMCAANSAMVIMIAFMRTSVSDATITNLVYAIGSAMICSVGSVAVMMLYEEIFGVATPFILMEMSGANDIAMRNLIAKAPGTYYHSIMVGNLAEVAASAIGANALLTRVGAYYHDIGKADKAMYYKENQGEETNPHDLISPDTSAKIIKNHVSDGVFAAEKSGVPDDVIEFIRTHHGTSELTYFKVKAEEEGYNKDEDFHYHGKLPVSKETTIVMLADSVEAAARTLDEKNIDTMTALIEKITEKKIAEGQLEDSKLTFNDLVIVKQSFADVLTNIYHSRIKYPEALTEHKDKPSTQAAEEKVD